MAKRKSRNRTEKSRSNRPPSNASERPTKSFRREFDQQLTSRLNSEPLPGKAYDDPSLVRAKSAWYFGDWDSLAAIDLAIIERHPNRAVLALLVGSAYQQLEQHEKAQHLARQSLNWGCNQKTVAQILIAGVHNSLGRIAALRKDEAGVIRHFGKAVDVGAPEHNDLPLSQNRSLREMARLGLLPQAAALLGKELNKTSELALRPEAMQGRIKALETEMELLNHELSLAQQRQQLFRAEAETKLPIQSNHDSAWLDALAMRSVSQLGQDLWVLKMTGYKRGGFFVEFGATDGVLLSNSYLLEKEFDWTGICAEPNPKFFRKLQENRRCLVSNALIAGETGLDVEFIFADAYGSMSKYADADAHAEKRAAYAAAGRTAVLKTVSLDDFLRQNGAPHVIDYLSIDTEGSEYEILTVFPFAKWEISLITVEHNYTPQREMIRALLGRNGYQCFPREWDDWYVHMPQD